MLTGITIKLADFFHAEMLTRPFIFIDRFGLKRESNQCQRGRETKEEPSVIGGSARRQRTSHRSSARSSAPKLICPMLELIHAFYRYDRFQTFRRRSFAQ
jgi:hypothetical protein